MARRAKEPEKKTWLTPDLHYAFLYFLFFALLMLIASFGLIAEK